MSPRWVLMARLKVFRIRKTKKQFQNCALQLVRVCAPRVANAVPAGGEGPTPAVGARGGRTAYFPVGVRAV